jgi:hypothetical protein
MKERGDKEINRVIKCRMAHKREKKKAEEENKRTEERSN